MKVYIAASSDDIERAEHWTALLRAEGVDVISTWMANVRAVGAANPRDATSSDRRGWAVQCLREVAACDLLWMLAPDEGHGRGAYAELGVAYALGKRVIVSGDTTQSVFCALGTEEMLDGGAAALAIDLARRPHTEHLAAMNLSLKQALVNS